MLPAINRFGAFARSLQALLGLVLFAFYVREAVLHRWQFLFTMVLHSEIYDGLFAAPEQPLR